MSIGGLLGGIVWVCIWAFMPGMGIPCTLPGVPGVMLPAGPPSMPFAGIVLLKGAPKLLGGLETSYQAYLNLNKLQKSNSSTLRNILGSTPFLVGACAKKVQIITATTFFLKPHIEASNFLFNLFNFLSGFILSWSLKGI